MSQIALRKLGKSEPLSHLPTYAVLRSEWQKLVLVCDICFSVCMSAVQQPHQQCDRCSNDPRYEKQLNEAIDDVMSGKYVSWREADKKTGVSFII